MKRTMALIENHGIVPVITIPGTEAASPLAEALERGGLPLVEITCRNEYALPAIRDIKKSNPAITVGAGTVLDTEQAAAALDAGADFVVAPGMNPEVVEFCLKKGAPILPGCVTPTEIEAGRKLGLRTFKFFPSEQLGGVKTIKELSGPYRDVRFVPTSGITSHNLLDYLSCDAVAAVGGSFMAPAAQVASGDWDGITERCRQAVRTALNFTLVHIGMNGDQTEGEARARRFAELFDLPYRQGERSDFAGELVESGKVHLSGEKGHLAIGTPSVERAAGYLAKKGVQFREDTRRVDSRGRTTLLYLAEEIGGFAIHLLRR